MKAILPIDKYKVVDGEGFTLSNWDSADLAKFRGGKEAGLKIQNKVSRRLSVLQEILYAEHKHKILILLQGMDTSGKDGVIRHVFEAVNPQGTRVANFKHPTDVERDHDYLWKVHKQTPAMGEIVIFNRSHYEEVLFVRVHKMIGEKECHLRFAQIRDFERLLVEEGTTLFKFFLNISKETQKERLRERILDPQKQWKF